MGSYQFLTHFEKFILDGCDSLFNLQWVFGLGGTYFDWCSSLSIGLQGEIVVAGAFYSQIDIDPSPSNNYTLTSAGDYDVFVASYTANGVLVSGFSIGGLHSDEATDLKIDINGDIMICGWFMDTVDFDPTNNVYNLGSQGNPQGFIAGYKSSFPFLWAVPVIGPNLSRTHSLCLGANGGIYAGGTFKGMVDVDPSSSTYALTSKGETDLFIVKYKLCAASHDTLTVINCQSYSLNGQTYTQSGTYMQTLVNYLGCDSIITLNLTIPNINDSVSRNWMTLTALQPGAAYQWINCENQQIIPGAISQSYNAPGHGRFAVIITLNGCIDTSDCINTYHVGMTELVESLAISVYPNPADQYFTICVNTRASAELFITIHDILGRLVWTDQFVVAVQAQINPDVVLPQGQYLVEVTDGHNYGVCKLVVK